MARPAVVGGAPGSGALGLWGLDIDARARVDRMPVFIARPGHLVGAGVGLAMEVPQPAALAREAGLVPDQKVE
jgi:hypothetical protein